MAYAFFRVSSADPEATSEELNRFIASHAVIRVERQFHAAQADGFWSFCIEYRPRQKALPPAAKSKDESDYRELLTAEEFAVFSRLRELRREIANRDGIQLYMVASNAQFAEMSRLSVAGKIDLKAIEGFGGARVRKYAAEILQVLRAVGGMEREIVATSSEQAGSDALREGSGAESQSITGKGDTDAESAKNRPAGNRELF